MGMTGAGETSRDRTEITLRTLVRACFTMWRLKMFVVAPVKLRQYKKPQREGEDLRLLHCNCCAIHRDVMWLNITGGQWHREQKPYNERSEQERAFEGVCGREMTDKRRRGRRVRRYDQKRKRSTAKKVNCLLWLHLCVHFKGCTPATSIQWHTMTFRDCNFTVIM